MVAMTGAGGSDAKGESRSGLEGMHVWVVGAGISGLAVAHALIDRGAHVEVVEAGRSPGGRIFTHRKDGYLVETGPNALRRSGGLLGRLLDRSGVALEEAPARAARFVVHRGRVVQVPSHPLRWLVSPLLSLRAKARIFGEPFVSATKHGREESVAAFLRRRFGSGVLPLVDAMVTGVHAGDPGRLSARHVLGPVVDWERSGGVLRNAAGSMNGLGAWVAPVEGMQAWVEALADPLEVRYAEKVLRVEPGRDGVEVQTDRGMQVADRVVMATDAGALRRILELDASPPPVAPVTVVAFGLPREDLLVEGYGVLAPEREKRFVLGALFESTLFPARAPEGHALVRCFVGGRRHPERASMPGDEIKHEAWRDLEGLGVVRGEPSWSMVVPTRGIPQMELGHQRWLDALPKRQGVHAVGIGNRGVGVAPLVQEASALVDRMSAQSTES